MYEEDKVSVIIPIFNPSKMIKKTLQSILDQSYTNLEIWLIDDGSSINYFNDIKKYLNEPTIHFIQLEKNVGPGEARNVGIAKSNGQYLAFIDSDDLWEKDKLLKQVDLMKKQNIGLCFSGYQVINDADHELVRTIKVPPILDYSSLLKNTIIGCSTVVIDRIKVGPVFMPAIKGSEDTATWLFVLKKGYQARGIQESLVRYYLRDQSFSNNKWKMLVRTWRMYRKTQGLSIISTSYYFSWYVFNAIKKRL